MAELLSNPAIKGGIAPFLVALVVALALSKVRMAGLAVLAAFLTCTYFVAGFQLTPLTALRKIVLIAVAASLVGLMLDLTSNAQRRIVAPLLAAVAASAALWAFWPVITAQPLPAALAPGLVVVAAAGFAVAVSLRFLASDGIRAGAAALGTGLGVGAAAIIGASASIGLQGISVGAGAGAFLLPQMIRGERAFAGATFALTAMLTVVLLASAAMVLAELPWYSVLVLAVAPLGASLPVPRTVPAWVQAALCTLYTLAIAGAACVLAWPTTQ